MQQSSLHPCLPLIQSLLPSGLPLRRISMQIPFCCCSSGTLRNEKVFVASGILKVRARAGKSGFDSCRQAGWRGSASRSTGRRTAAPPSRHTRPGE